ncbi:hypothetical protein EMCRGX_G022338 [Ephydatia muelleri]
MQRQERSLQELFMCPDCVDCYPGRQGKCINPFTKSSQAQSQPPVSRPSQPSSPESLPPSPCSEPLPPSSSPEFLNSQQLEHSQSPNACPHRTSPSPGGPHDHARKAMTCSPPPLTNRQQPHFDSPSTSATLQPPTLSSPPNPQQLQFSLTPLSQQLPPETAVYTPHCQIDLAVSYGQGGMLGKACKILTSSGLAPNNETTWNLHVLLSKHPASQLPSIKEITQEPVSLGSDFNILSVLRSFPKDTGAGPSGLCVQHLLDVSSTAHPTPICASLREVINLLASGKAPPIVSKYLAGGNLITLNKFKTGVQQGDPLGPMLFALVLHKLVSSIDADDGCLNLILQTWYLDDGVLAVRCAQAKKLLSVLLEMADSDLHVATSLLRICGGFCKLVHISRTTPTSPSSEALCAFDGETRSCFSACLAADVTDAAWQQAQLSLSFGGLGLRSIAFHSSSAFLASFSASATRPIPEKKASVRDSYKADLEKKASVRDSYKADPEKKKASVRGSCKADPEKKASKKASVRDSYKADPEKKKASVRDSYKADPEKKKASVRDSYNADIESKQSAKKQRYQEDLEENRAAKRQKYEDNSAAINASERNRHWNDPAVRLAKRAADRTHGSPNYHCYPKA